MSSYLGANDYVGQYIFDTLDACRCLVIKTAAALRALDVDVVVAMPWMTRVRQRL